MDYQNILFKAEEGIAYITINRPKALNALNVDVLTELLDAFKTVNETPEIKTAILTGEGRAFVAGADIAQMNELVLEEGRAMTMLGQKLMNYIENIDKPVIAAVNGFALGGGCELAMSCDIRIASEKAKFGQPEVNLGIIPGFGGTQRLPRLTNKGMAKYLIYTAEMINAEEALRIGLVQKVVAPEGLMEEAVRIAKLIMTKSQIAVRMAKYAINNGMNVDLHTGVAYEAEAYSVSFASDDRKEGMTAFLEKRPANFKS